MPVFTAPSFKTSTALPDVLTFIKVDDDNFAASKKDDIVYYGGTGLSAANYTASTTTFNDTLTTALGTILGPITSGNATTTLKGKIWSYYTTGGASTPSEITISGSNVADYVRSLKAGEFFNPVNNPTTPKNMILAAGDTILVPILLAAANGLETKYIYYGYDIVD